MKLYKDAHTILWSLVRYSHFAEFVSMFSSPQTGGDILFMQGGQTISHWTSACRLVNYQIKHSQVVCLGMLHVVLCPYETWLPGDCYPE